mmetsp:Transcript_53098/g.158902  ORF Transcript_53098/g.158902 Transcript_53098/m.158902 type:complete len:87 (-) Transcript_53098:1177-1437(-)
MIIGKCTELTLMQLQSLSEWGITNDTSDAIKLLKLIKSLSNQMNDQKYYHLSLHMEKRSIYTLRQGPYTSNAQLFENLKARVEIME